MSLVSSYRRILSGASLAFALVLLQAVPAQARPLNEVLPQFDRDVERIFGAYHVPGAALAIVQNGKVVYIKTLGVGSTKTRNPVNPHTVFRLASVSKTFAAVLAGQAAYEGQIRYSDPLSRYLPGFRLKYDPQQRLTLRNVLSHTSGLPHNANDHLLESGESYSALLQKTQRLGASCQIGRCFGYQNILYSTIGDVLSRQLGHSYADLLSNRLFRPLGMSDASTGRWSMLNNRNVAVPHVKGGGGWVPRAITQPYYNVLPAAGVNASITDMSKYLAAVMGYRPDVIPPAVMAELTRPVVRSPKEGATSKWRQTRIKQPMYGMGWRIFQYNGNHKMIFHAGGLSGVRSRLGFLPEKNIGLVMMWNANESRPEVLMPMLFDRLLDLPAVDYLDGAASSGAGFYTNRQTVTTPVAASAVAATAAATSALTARKAAVRNPPAASYRSKPTVPRSGAVTQAVVEPKPVAAQQYGVTVDSDGIRSLTAQRVGYDPATGPTLQARQVTQVKAPSSVKKQNSRSVSAKKTSVKSTQAKKKSGKKKKTPARSTKHKTRY